MDNPIEQRPADSDFIKLMRDKWKNGKSAATFASIHLVNSGHEYTALFECATLLRDTVGVNYYNEDLGVPRYKVPNQDLMRVLNKATDRYTVALLDTAIVESGKEYSTKLVAVWVINARNTRTNERSTEPPTKTEIMLLGSNPTTTSRFKSDTVNVSNTPKVDPEPAPMFAATTTERKNVKQTSAQYADKAKPGRRIIRER